MQRTVEHASDLLLLLLGSKKISFLPSIWTWTLHLLLHLCKLPSFVYALRKKLHGVGGRWEKHLFYLTAAHLWRKSVALVTGMWLGLTKQYNLFLKGKKREKYYLLVSSVYCRLGRQFVLWKTFYTRRLWHNFLFPCYKLKDLTRRYLLPRDP